MVVFKIKLLCSLNICIIWTLIIDKSLIETSYLKVILTKTLMLKFSKKAPRKLIKMYNEHIAIDEILTKNC